MERIVPDELSNPFDLDSLKLHLDRYHFAGKYLMPGRILDIACGTGYGSYLLATEYKEFISGISGVDISAESISYASKRYAHANIKFIECDAFQFSDVHKYNSIVTLETIEHVPDPTAFISRLFDLLLPGGMLIASAPVTPSTDFNPHHLNDFSDRSFRALFDKRLFNMVAGLEQTQTVSLKELLGKKEQNRLGHIRKNILVYYFSHPAVLMARTKSTLRWGLSNKYRVLALKKN